MSMTHIWLQRKVLEIMSSMSLRTPGASVLGVFFVLIFLSTLYISIDNANGSGSAGGSGSGLDITIVICYNAWTLREQLNLTGERND